MGLVEVGLPSAVEPLRAERPNQASSRSASLRPGWPLTAVLIGYPLWWIIGIASFLPLVAATIMARELLRQRRIYVRRSFGLIVVFLAWAAVGVALLQINAVGAVPGTSSNRYLTFAFRMAWYVTAVITLVYVYNKRDELSTDRITRAFGWFFVTVVVGGVVGTLASRLQFPSLLELILPRGLTRIPFVKILVHPTLAQLFTNGGVPNPRASAPFAYTNDWGLNFACLLPFFLVGWCGRDAGWRRKLAPWVLVLAIYPMVMTQNRGMWVTLLVLGVFVAARGLVFGRLRAVAAVGVLLAALVVVLLTTPLGSTIASRLSGPSSDHGRSSLGAQTVSSVLETSPIAGLGTTRNAQGAFYSIAGGDSPSCEHCSPPALGTQGHFWLLIYSTGLGGLFLYLGFMLVQFVRYATVPSRVATMGLAVIVVHLCTMFVYDSVDVALMTIFAAIGLLWREAREVESAFGVRRSYGGDQPLTAYVHLARTNTWLIVGCLLVGTVGGYAYGRSQGRPVAASATVLAPLSPSYPGVTTAIPAQTPDTIAKFIDSPAVLAAVQQVAGYRVEPGIKQLWVTATPNSRLLQIHFESHKVGVASAGARAAAQALLDVRAQVLTQARNQAIESLDALRSQVVAAVSTIDTAQRVSVRVSRRLFDLRAQLVGRAAVLSSYVTNVSSAPVRAGSILSVSAVAGSSDIRLIWLCTGLLLGLLIGVMLALLRQRRGVILSRRSAVGLAGLPLLAQLPPVTTARNTVAERIATSSRYARTAAVLDNMRVDAFLPLDADAAAEAACKELDQVRSRLRSPGSTAGKPTCVAFVGGERTRSASLLQARRSLHYEGVVPIGVILIVATPKARYRKRLFRYPDRAEYILRDVQP